MVLPAPFFPIKPYKSPSSIVMFKSDTAFFPFGYILVKFFISSILLKFPLSITSHLEKILNEKQKNKLPFLTIITFRIFLSIFIMPTPILLLPQ